MCPKLPKNGQKRSETALLETLKTNSTCLNCLNGILLVDSEAHHCEIGCCTRRNDKTYFDGERNGQKRPKTAKNGQKWSNKQILKNF